MVEACMEIDRIRGDGERTLPTQRLQARPALSSHGRFPLANSSRRVQFLGQCLRLGPLRVSPVSESRPEGRGRPVHPSTMAARNSTNRNYKYFCQRVLP